MKSKVILFIRLALILALALGYMVVPDRVVRAYPCPCSIWGGTGSPEFHTTETLPVELGFQFRSDAAGYITAIRFYKGRVENAGPHYGHLWSKDGTLLGEVLFTNESDTGWQEAILPTPVAILANTTYIASYHSPVGRWSATSSGLASEVYTEPLRALANAAEAPGNGVYKYGAYIPGGLFPTESYGATNYWVDVVFNETVGPDTTPPTVVTTTPAGGATGVAVDANLTAHFSEAMEPLTLTASTIELRDASTNLVSAAISYTSGNYTVSINPDANLAYATTYTARIIGGAGGATDHAGNPLAADFTWSFTTEAPDTTPPTVAATTPAGGATNVAVGSDITARFSEAINPATLTTTTFELRDASSNLVPAAISYTAGTFTATLNPDANLAYATTYTARVIGGAGGVADIAGNRLVADFTWNFTTADPPPPPPDEGPGGPILVVADAGNPFGRYYAEILRNEGFNEFTVTDILNLTPEIINAHDVVVLAEMSRTLTPAEVTLLTDWVTAGGNLVAMRPDAQLAGLLGLTRVSGVLPAPGTLNAYLLIDTAAPPGQGLVSETIQYHGLADLYTLNGAASIATLYLTATTATTNPAVTLQSVGSNGGEAAAFTYDLARSVVYTRQGNPAWAAQNRDLNAPAEPRIISNDLYYGNAPGDPQPDYIDWTKITIPQADEQMRLLANLIQHMNRDKKPLPHFWYFPRMEKAVVIMTGDDHGTGGTPGRFDHYNAISPVGCNVEDWECIRASSYIFPMAGLTDALAAQYTAQGFEIGQHINTNCGDWTPASLTDFYNSQIGSFHSLFPSLPPQMSERTHCVTWTDWVTQAKVQATHGIRMDTNYYYYPANWVNERPGMFTGSGMIMRFADLDGTMIDVYQAVTQMTDESSLAGYGAFNPLQINTLLGNAVGPNGYYGAFTTNMHTDTAIHSGSITIVNAALANGVPVVSGKQMVTWLDGRNASSFENLTWIGGNLSFDIEAHSGANGLRTLVPYNTSSGRVVEVTLDGSSVSFTREVIKGTEYAIFAAQDGSYVVQYEPDTTAPVISNVSVISDPRREAFIEWDTDEPATSQVVFGTDPDVLNLSESSALLVTGHSITLTDLDPSTTYYLRIRSTDLAGNTAEHPAAGLPPLSFTTPSAAFIDDTYVEFSLGTTIDNTYVTLTDDGEVILEPLTAHEFSGSTLPADWFVAQYPVEGTNGTAVVSSGRLTVDGTRTGPNALSGPGTSLEFVANFSGAQYQHIGFGTDFNAGPWAIFSIGQQTGTFLARTNSSVGGYTPQETPLSASLINTPHRFRIDWRSDRFVYYVDGVQVAEHLATVTEPLRPMVSDYLFGAGTVWVDWLRMSPYQTPGIFQSRIFDSLGTATWLTPNWEAQIPSGTGLAISVRTGDTPTPDPSWSGFTPVQVGYPIGRSSRYIQYQAEMTTTDPSVSPILELVAFGYTLSPDVTPPVIEARSPLPNAVDVALDSNLVVVFNEAMHPDTITAANIRLRAAGASTDVAGVVTYADRTATLNPDSDLALGTLYYATVSTGVTDVSGNPLASEATWSFTTSRTGTFTDNTQAEFGAGAPGTGTYVSHTADGEVILKPALGDEFNGPNLPPDWTQTAYGAGGSTIPVFDAGWLVVDGVKVGPNATFGPGRWLEFYARFQNTMFTHAGFGVNYDNPPWAIFSTEGTGNVFQARSANGSTAIDLVPNPAIVWDNVPHLYRIEWNADSIVFKVDGVQVSSHAIIVGAAMRPLLGEYNPGGENLRVDWLRMGPYALSGDFHSRVFDFGNDADRAEISWNADLPAGTGLTFEVRTGSTPTPDATWSAFSPITNGGTINPTPTFRYIQYRALFTSPDPALTPTLNNVTIHYTIEAPTSVTMSEWTASAQPRGVRIEWSTAQEIDVIGFNILRSDSLNGLRRQVNQNLIPASGDLFGSSYRFEDDTAAAGKTYFYWIECVEINGSGEVIGPLSISTLLNFYLPFLTIR